MGPSTLAPLGPSNQRPDTREDASLNLAAIAEMNARIPGLDLMTIESGGDNLAATFSPELADITIYGIDVLAGDKIPGKAGLGKPVG